MSPSRLAPDPHASLLAHSFAMHVDEYRHRAARPLLESLAFFETLHELPLPEAEALVRAVDLDQDEGWVGPVLARVVPLSFWTKHFSADFDFDRHAIEEAVARAMGDRWLDVLAGAIDEGPPVLRRLHAKLTENPELADRLERHWPRVVELATHDSLAVRDGAARVALCGKRTTPGVIDAVRDLLARATSDDVDVDSYDDQVLGEELLAEVAGGGPSLAELAPSIAPLLTSRMQAFRASAAFALGALGDPSVVTALQRAERARESAEGGFAVGAVRAMIRFALWQLTGEARWLEGALDDAGDSVVYAFRLHRAFARMPMNGRFLDGVAIAGRRPSWRRSAFELLAKAGAPAAPIISELTHRRPLLPRGEDPDAKVAELVARSQAGLLDDAAFAEGLEPLLATSFHAWAPWVGLALFTEGWSAPIRWAIANDARSGVLSALVERPHISSRFLRELVAAEAESCVLALWRDLPRETFWAAV